MVAVGLVEVVVGIVGVPVENLSCLDQQANYYYLVVAVVVVASSMAHVVIQIVEVQDVPCLKVHPYWVFVPHPLDVAAGAAVAAAGAAAVVVVVVVIVVAAVDVIDVVVVGVVFVGTAAVVLLRIVAVVVGVVGVVVVDEMLVVVLVVASSSMVHVMIVVGIVGAPVENFSYLDQQANYYYFVVAVVVVASLASYVNLTVERAEMTGNVTGQASQEDTPFEEAASDLETLHKHWEAIVVGATYPYHNLVPWDEVASSFPP